MNSSSLGDPLLSSAPQQVSTWMHDHINGTIPEDKASRDLKRRVAKSFVAIMVIAQNAFFYASNPGKTVAEKLPFAACNIIGISILDCWAGAGSINNKYPFRAGLDEKLSQAQMPLRRLAAKVFSTIIVLFAQSPATYAAFQYNQNLCPGLPGLQKILPYIAASTVFVGGIPLAWESMRLYMKNSLDTREAKELHINPERQKQFLSQIHEGSQRFIKMTPEERIAFKEELDRIKALPESSAKVEAYWKHLLGSFVEEDQLQVSTGDSPDRYTQVARGIGFLSMAIHQGVIGTYTFFKTEEDTLDNDGFAALTAILTVFSTIYLIQTAMADSAESLSHTIANVVAGKNIYESEATFAEVFGNEALIGLRMLFATINVGALGVSWTIWRDFFNTNEVESISLAVLMCFACYLLLYPSMLATTQGVSEYAISQKGTPEQKQAIQTLKREFQDLENAVRKLSPGQFEEFLSHASIPETIASKLPANPTPDDGKAFERLMRDIHQIEPYQNHDRDVESA